MAATTAEGIGSGTIPVQIMAPSTEQPIQVSSSQVLPDTLSESITTTLQSISQQRAPATAIATVSLPETVPNADCVSVGSGENAVHAVSGEGITHEQAQNILHTTTSEVMDENMDQEQHHTVSAQETIMIPSENVNIVTSNTDPMQIVSVPSNLPPWAARLHDCELIGDSYRGYVTNEVELDLILTLHKQNTNSCWGTRQSPSSAKPSIRLMWKSQYVPYDGIPFLNTGRRATVMECQYGPRRKGSSGKKAISYEGGGHKMHKLTCPARIYVKKVKKFPGCQIDPTLEGKNVRQAQERALTALRLAGVETGGEERYYVQLPLPIAHEYHEVDDIPLTPSNQLTDVEGQRLNPQVITKIHELVARGVEGVYHIKHYLKLYVEKELFEGMEPPPRHNKAYFPTIIDMQNHIHQAQVSLAEGTLLPLPPITDLPSKFPVKERTRKRKHTPEKHNESAQVTESFQTAQAVASIQHEASLTQGHQGNGDHPSLTDQIQQEMLQTGEHMSPSAALQHQLVATEQHGTGEMGMQQQPQILITQNTGRGEGQVMIVMTSSNTFSENTTTLAFSTLQPSQLTSLAQGTFDTGSSPQTLTVIHPIPQNSESSGQTTYLATQGQGAGSILTVLQPSISHGGDAEVIGVVTEDGQLQTTDGTPVQTTGQLLANQTAVGTVLSTTTMPSTEPTPGNVQVTSIQQVNSNGEPFAKRPPISYDLTSLVKEAVFDSQLLGKSDGKDEPSQSMTMGMQPVTMVTQASTTLQQEPSTARQENSALEAKNVGQTNDVGVETIATDTQQPISEQYDSSSQESQSGGVAFTTVKVETQAQDINVTVL